MQRKATGTPRRARAKEKTKKNKKEPRKRREETKKTKKRKKKRGGKIIQFVKEKTEILREEGRKS